MSDSPMGGLVLLDSETGSFAVEGEALEFLSGRGITPAVEGKVTVTEAAQVFADGARDEETMRFGVTLTSQLHGTDFDEGMAQERQFDRIATLAEAGSEEAVQVVQMVQLGIAMGAGVPTSDHLRRMADGIYAGTLADVLDELAGELA